MRNPTTICAADLTDLRARLRAHGLMAAANGRTVHLCDATTPRDHERLALYVLVSSPEGAAWKVVRELELGWLPEGVVVYPRIGQVLAPRRTNAAMKRALNRLLRTGAVTRVWSGPRRYRRWRWTAV